MYMDGVSNVYVLVSAVRNFEPLLAPCFVVITMTPLAARDPYNAAAFGPFNTDIDSISSGLMSLITLPRSRPDDAELVNDPTLNDPSRLSLETGTPSTTNSGLLSPLIELDPGIVILVEAPGVPEPVTVMPETLPAS